MEEETKENGDAKLDESQDSEVRSCSSRFLGRLGRQHASENKYTLGGHTRGGVGEVPEFLTLHQKLVLNFDL